MTSYYAQYSQIAGKRVPTVLFRREVEGDPRSDGVYQRDGSWVFMPRLALWMNGRDDSDIEEIDESAANEIIARAETTAG
jgi:hypothetical protein